MLIQDNIYGEFEVKDDVLLDLLQTKSLERLKTVSQYGVPDRYFSLKNFYRYEHSVGVMLLLRKLGASLDEQIAGLLHDVSHSAFSHVIDFVFGRGEEGLEDYQDLGHRDFIIMQTNIPSILVKYNIDIEKVVNEGNFSLLENNVPDICADRIDYALREMHYWLDPDAVRKCLSGLIVYNDEIIFKDKENAFLFASNFLELQTRNWGSEETVRRVYLLSKALKIAYKNGIISKNDFYGEEADIIKKIEKADNLEIQEIIVRLKSDRIVVVSGETRVVKKFRHVDPKVMHIGNLQRLSDIDKDFQKKLEEHRVINKKGIFVE